MAFVPGCERRHDDARVDGNHRRVRSRVSLTMSSVSRGSFSTGTATEPPRRRTRFIGVTAGSISRRPSRSRISTCLPRRRPSRSRSSFGITIRPAPSMAVFMVLLYHISWVCRSDSASTVAPIRQAFAPVGHCSDLAVTPNSLLTVASKFPRWATMSFSMSQDRMKSSVTLMKRASPSARWMSDAGKLRRRPGVSKLTL